MVCKKTANKCPSNKSGSLQCTVCSLWYHPPCANVDNSVLEIIVKCVEKGMPSPWNCGVCESGLAKMAADVKQNTARVGKAEIRLDKVEADYIDIKQENEKLKERLQTLETKMVGAEAKAAENSGDTVLQEVSDRASRERNVVLHRCIESPREVGEEQAKADDLAGTQTLFNELGLREMKAEEVLIGWRRLGKAGENIDRPLLLIFRTKEDRAKLLNRAPRLSRNSDETFKNISIVPDLTPKQRQMEKEMFKQAERNNLARTEDQASKNLASKVLGKRGERVLRTVELRDYETINEEGRVVRKGVQGMPAFPTHQNRQNGTNQNQNQMNPNQTPLGEATKRKERSPGMSPPSRRGMFPGARFGGRPL